MVLARFWHIWGFERKSIPEKLLERPNCCDKSR
jgi:hypothetical protein